MSDLFTMLNIAARALDAQRYGLDVAGQNIANVNTPGYVRRSVQLGEAPPVDPWSPGGGVDVVAVTAARAPVIEARLRYEQPAAAREGAIADQLAVVETGLGQPGASLDAALARFYNTYGTLGQNPTSATARQQVIVEGQNLARSFRELTAQLQTARATADRELRSAVGEVNALARRVADLNESIAAAGMYNAQGLLDQQAAALAELGMLVDINAIPISDGTMDVTIGNGRALVTGGHTEPLRLSSQPPYGYAQVTTDGADVTTDVTTEITAGTLGGLRQVRDVLLPGYITALDELAYGVATDVNTLTTGGYDLNGDAGLAFFAPPAAVAGAASALAVNTLVADDTNLVVAGATSASGNNEIARSIAGLQDAAMTGSAARPVDAWGTLVYRVASDTRAATKAKEGHEQVVQQLQTLKDQISGVSIDEEAAMLLRFQRAYEANARFFQVTSQTLDLLMSLVRV